MRATMVGGLLAAAALALSACSSVVAGTPSGVTTATSAAAAATSAAPAPVAPAGITPSGTTLPVGSAASVEYEVSTGSTDTSTLTVSVDSVAQGSIADLADFQLDAQTKLGVPFYVSMTFHNTGAQPLDPGGVFGLVNAHNADGDELAGLSLIGEFEPCGGDEPDSLAPGKTFTECHVYIAPAGQRAADVVLGFYVGDKPRTEITWKV